MDIYSTKGTKVIFNNINGHDYDLEHARKYLKEGEKYTVDFIDVGAWSTSVYLEEFPGISFNSVMFDDETYIYEEEDKVVYTKHSDVATIKGMTLRLKRNALPFMSKLLTFSSLDSNEIKVGSIITIQNGTRYVVNEIIAINLSTSDIELLVNEL